VSWRGGADYQLTSSTLLYANVSRGYKAGSFPSLAASSFKALEPVTQEYVTSYEAGFKTRFFDRKASVEGAIFYDDYRNKQIRGKIADPIFGALDALVNIPKSTIKGAELNLTAHPVHGFTFTGGITYLDSEVKQYSGTNALGQQNFDAAGDPLPFTPKWAGSTDFEYRFDTSHGQPYVGLTVRAQTSQDAELSAQRLDYSGPGTIIACLSG